jgi:nitroreductase
MELEKAILQRRSIRRFTEEPIEQEVLTKILKAGIWSPTASNQQVWRFICVVDPKNIHNIKTVSPGLLGQPTAVICICYDPEKSAQKVGKMGPEMAKLDIAMAAQNIMLRAFDLGIGTCVIASTNKAAVSELINLPEHMNMELLVTLGHYNKAPKPPARNEEVIYWEQYQKREE